MRFIIRIKNSCQKYTKNVKYISTALLSDFQTYLNLVLTSKKTLNTYREKLQIHVKDLEGLTLQLAS